MDLQWSKADLKAAKEAKGGVCIQQFTALDRDVVLWRSLFFSGVPISFPPIIARLNQTNQRGESGH